jgi:hypothetical protein
MEGIGRWRESVIRFARLVSSAAWVLDSSYRCRCLSAYFVED